MNYIKEIPQHISFNKTVLPVKRIHFKPLVSVEKYLILDYNKIMNQ